MKKNPKKNKNSALVIILSVLIVILAVMLLGFGILFVFSQKKDDSAKTQDSSEETTQPSLSDLFIQYEDSSNLLIYSGSALKDFSYPEYILTDYGLLLFESNYSESADSCVNFILLDLNTGNISAEASFGCEFITDIRQTDEGIMYADSGLGCVVLLDETLSEIKTWSFEGNYEYWYVSADGKSLFMIDDNSLSRIDLESGESEILLTSSVSLYGGSSLNSGANISYIDEDQMSINLWLDLESGSLLSQSFDEAVSYLTLNDDIWLVSLSGVSYEYILGPEEDALYVQLEDGYLSQIENSDYILYSDDYNNLTLYDSSGSFISGCSVLGDTTWFYSDTCVYSDTYDGFFILAYSDNGPMLLFWNWQLKSEGDDLAAVSLLEYEETGGGIAAESYLYEEAKALGDEYGIEILIADQCQTEFDDFTAQQITDTQLIEEGLETLRTALSNYPEGFFEQIKYDQVTKIQINLMGELTPTNSNWGDESYNGLTEEYKNYILMIFDLNQLYTDTVYHEMSHAIDKKLAWDSYCRESALFSEESWEALNPDDFEYDYIYNGFENVEFTGDEYMYFIDTYSMISPTEDRARILEYSMAGYDSYFTDYEPIAAKLSYYCECIRDCFDTSGWPDVCAWEEALN